MNMKNFMLKKKLFAVLFGVTAMLAFVPAVASATELVLNGGFESEYSSWTYNSAIVAYDYTLAHTGNYYAVFGTENNLNEKLEQTIVVPPSQTTPQLSFWYNITSYESTTVKPFDTLYVNILDSATRNVLATKMFSNLNKQGGDGRSYYAHYNFGDVPIPAGRSIILQFSSSLDGSDPTTFRIDDVSMSYTPVQTYAITASAGTGGSISPSGDVTVNIGDSKTFNFYPSSGYKIEKVIVDNLSVGAPTYYQITGITSNHTISVTFTQITGTTFPITITQGVGGTNPPPGTYTEDVAQGMSRTYSITPASGYQISNVIVDGANKGAISSYVFPNVQSSHTMSVTFTANSHPQCSDGVDNDSDGKIDYPADPGCSSSADNDEADVVNNIAPIAVLVANTTSTTGTMLVFDGSGSYDSDGTIIHFEWDFGDGSGSAIPVEPTESHIYTTAGTYTVTLRVTDDKGAVGVTSKNIIISDSSIPPENHLPTLSFVSGPQNNEIVKNTGSAGSFKTVTFKIIYTDVDNNAPQYVKLHIKGNTWAWKDGLILDMEHEISGNVDYRNGEVYTYAYDIPNETYTYYFTASDSISSEVFLTQNGNASLSFYQCGKNLSGMDTCDLKKGDILFTLSKDWVALGGIGRFSWSHSAIYLGDGKVAEANGPGFKGYSLENQVSVDGVNDPHFGWNKIDMINWAIVRPTKDKNGLAITDSQASSSAEYAREKANQTNPSIPYNTYLWDKSSEETFYCSQLVWRAYKNQGVDLLTSDFDLYPPSIIEPVPPLPPSGSDIYNTVVAVSPDDLYRSIFTTTAHAKQGDLIAIKDSSLLRFSMYSPADLLLTDKEGRRTGFDPITGTILNEIPGSYYTGQDEHPETITVTGGNISDYNLQVVGNDTGLYTLDMVAMDGNWIKEDIIQKNTEQGKKDEYSTDSINDIIAPVTTVATSEQSTLSGSYFDHVTVTLNAIDNLDGVGVEKTLYLLDNGEWQAYTASNTISVSGVGTHILKYYSVDRFGNTEETKTTTFTIKVDHIAPTTTHTLSGTLGQNDWYTSSVNVALDATDNEDGVGVAKTFYLLDDTGTNAVVQPVASTSPVSETNNPPSTVDTAPVTTTETSDVTSTSDAMTTQNFVESEVIGVPAPTPDYESATSSPTLELPIPTPASGDWREYTGVITIPADGVHTLRYYSVDWFGNAEAEKSIDFKIDQTKPIFTGEAIPNVTASGWYKEDVKVQFTCNDTTSGVANAFDNKLLSDEGANQSVTGTCTDNAGNITTTTVSGINIDKTAPTITATRTLANANGWNNTDVKIHYTCTDTLSGASCPMDDILSNDGANQSVTKSSTDRAGNTASITVSDINIDKTAPTITAERTPTANVNGWNNSNVTVMYACTDGLSGVASCSPNAVLANEGARQSAVGNGTDKAGNTARVVVSDINIDKTAPEIVVDFSPVTEQYVFSAVDVVDPSATVACMASDCMAIDSAGNTSKVTFVKDDKKTKHTLQFKTISYNSGAIIDVSNVKFDVNYKETAKDVFKDFDHSFTIKGDEKLRVDYQKKKDESVVTTKMDGEKKIKETMSGLRTVHLVTKNGKFEASVISFMMGAISVTKDTGYADAQMVTVPVASSFIGSFILNTSGSEAVNLNALKLDFTPESNVGNMSDVYLKYGTKTTSVKSAVVAGENIWNIASPISANSQIRVEVYATLGENMIGSITSSLSALGTTAVYGVSVSSGPIVGQTVTALYAPGSLEMIKDTSPVGTISKDAVNVTLARYQLTAFDENIKIENLRVAVNASAGGNDASLRNGMLFANGVQVGTTSPILEIRNGVGYTQFNLGSSLIVKPGFPVSLEIRADVYNEGATALEDGDTITAQILPGENNMKRMRTLDSISNSSVYGNTLTVAVGGILLKSMDPEGQTTVVPVTAYKLGSFNLMTTGSEAVNLDTLIINFGLASSSLGNITDVYLQYGTKWTSVKSILSEGDNHWIIGEALEPRTILPIEVYATLGSGMMGSVTPSLSVKGTTAVSNRAVSTETISGHATTIVSGTLNAEVVDDPLLPRLLIGNTTPKIVSFKFTATNDVYRITRLDLGVSGENNSATAGVIRNFVVKSAGMADKIVVMNSDTSAILTGLNIEVPANDLNGRTVDVYVNLNDISTPTSGQSGADVKVSLVAFQAVSSAGVMYESGPISLAGESGYVYKSIPMIATVSLPITALSLGTQTISKFTVVSDPASSIGWKKIVWTVTKSPEVSIVPLDYPVYDSTGNVLAGTVTTSGDLYGNGTDGTITFVAENEQELSTPETYSLKANIGGSFTPSSFLSVSIENPSTRHQMLNAYSFTSLSGSFIWTDRSAYHHAVDTLDWSNDFLVKNLPTEKQTLRREPVAVPESTPTPSSEIVPPTEPTATCEAPQTLVDNSVCTEPPVIITETPSL